METAMKTSTAKRLHVRNYGSASRKTPPFASMSPHIATEYRCLDRRRSSTPSLSWTCEGRSTSKTQTRHLHVTRNVWRVLTFELEPFDVVDVAETDPDARLKTKEDDGKDSKLLHIFFGRLVRLQSNYRDTSLKFVLQVTVGKARALVQKFDVKKRSYYGNTSMESEISLLMANQTLVITILRRSRCCANCD